MNEEIKAKKKVLLSLWLPGIIALLIVAGGIYLALREENLPESTVVMTIRGDSMEPTLQSGQEVVVDTEYYQNNPLQRGDIVAFSFHMSPTKYVKRVIAIEDDFIEFQGTKILINGNPLPEEYLQDLNYQLSTNELKTILFQLERHNNRVTQGCFLALSDNRIRSHDSRFWGLLSTKHIIGKVINY